MLALSGKIEVLTLATCSSPQCLRKLFTRATYRYRQEVLQPPTHAWKRVCDAVLCPPDVYRVCASCRHLYRWTGRARLTNCLVMDTAVQQALETGFQHSTRAESAAQWGGNAALCRCDLWLAVGSTVVPFRRGQLLPLLRVACQDLRQTHRVHLCGHDAEHLWPRREIGSRSCSATWCDTMNNLLCSFALHTLLDYGVDLDPSSTVHERTVACANSHGPVRAGAASLCDVALLVQGPAYISKNSKPVSLFRWDVKALDAVGVILFGFENALPMIYNELERRSPQRMLTAAQLREFDIALPECGRGGGAELRRAFHAQLSRAAS